jgi:hypothetical protein
LDLISRYRFEYWHAPQSDDSNDIHGIRTRVGLRYSWRDALSLYAQMQDTRVLGLDDPPNSGGGAAGLYQRSATPGSSSTESIRLRQGYLDVRLAEGSFLRAGRQDINMGTMIGYDDGAWSWLKKKRLSQRLVGSVGWTNGERSYDGVSGVADLEDFFIHAFAAQPTKGVFDIEDAYKTQDGILLAGLDFTVKRDRLLQDTEFTAFAIVYDDVRSKTKSALGSSLQIYTLGASAMGIYPLGPGRVDALLWVAGQWGDYGDLDHAAWALLAEAGYQLPELFLKPWLRVGVNAASGDDDPGDGDHATFFNLLPTNHLYYGAIDQLAFQNLVDFFVQLRLAPHERVGFELSFHRFWLQDDNDARYFGSGAFDDSLGFGSSPSGGSGDLGEELDLTLSLKLHKHLSVMAGYSRIWGGDVYDGFPHSNGDWAFAQVQVSY